MAYHRWLREITPPWPEGEFDLVTIDLPLSFIAYSPKGEGRSPQARYATLEPRTCIRLLRPLLAAVIAKNSISAWWVYGPRAVSGPGARFRVALGQIIAGCGFTYTTELLAWIKVDHVVEREDGVWVKPGAFGEGKTTRKGVENVWGAKRGKGIPIRDHSVDQRVFAPRGGHSEKPDEAYHALERLYGDVRRLELFATKLRPGWTGWGHIKGSKFVARLLEQGLL
jgi:hypothetical protein